MSSASCGSTSALNNPAPASNDFIIALFLAVTFIYMVLASQFNSFIYPFSIMSSLPLSVPAGLLAVMAFGMTPVVYSYFDDLREIDWFALVRRWTSIGVYGRRDSTAQAD